MLGACGSEAAPLKCVGWACGSNSAVRCTNLALAEMLPLCVLFPGPHLLKVSGGSSGDAAS
jgi:hypothetical protein